MICFPLSPCGEESDMVDEICFLLEYCPFDIIVGGCNQGEPGRKEMCGIVLYGGGKRVGNI